MGERLTNDFSWSRSRDNTFQECRRKYFYQYYGSWGGWEADAPADVRRLYVLKQLSSRQQWAGRVVHDAIEMALHVLREGRDVPVEPFVTDVIERMRAEWRSSKAGTYRDRPKTTALFEHEYLVDLKPEAYILAASACQEFRALLLLQLDHGMEGLVSLCGTIGSHVAPFPAL